MVPIENSLISLICQWETILIIHIKNASISHCITSFLFPGFFHTEIKKGETEEKRWRLFEQQSSGLLTSLARFINLGDSHSHLLNNSDSQRVTQPQ